MPFILGVTGDFTALSVSCTYGAAETVFLGDDEHTLPTEDLQTILDSTYLLHQSSNIFGGPWIPFTEDDPIYNIYPHNSNASYSITMQGNHIYIDNITYVIIGENKIAPMISPYCKEAREE